MIEGVDYSWGRPGGQALAAAGKRFAIRYVPYPGAPAGKCLAPQEMADLQAHGIAVALVFESTSGRARGGHDAGVQDGKWALAGRASLGIAADRPVYFAVDFNTTPNDYPVIDAYLRGAAESIGASAVGVYGEAALVDRMKALGSARWFWQTYAWSAGAVSDAAHVLQYLNGQTINGASVDLCRAFTADFGQTPRPGPKPDAPKRYRVRISGGHEHPTWLYADHSTGSARSGPVYSATVTATRSMQSGAWWYRVLSASSSAWVGKWFQAQPWMEVSAL